jgi:hypothetical protein
MFPKLILIFTFLFPNFFLSNVHHTGPTFPEFGSMSFELEEFASSQSALNINFYTADIRNPDQHGLSSI